MKTRTGLCLAWALAGVACCWQNGDVRADPPPVREQSVSQPASTTRGADVQSLLTAAQACGDLVKDPYERALALARLAEVEHLTGRGSSSVTIAKAERAARETADKYRQTLSLCEIARVRELGGADPCPTLREAETTAETIRVEPSLSRVLWDTVKAAANAAMGGAAATRNPLSPPPWSGTSDGTQWYLDASWYSSPPAIRQQMASDWLMTHYTQQYAAQREDWEAQQRHLRDLARSRVAGSWCIADPAHALEVAERIEEAGLRADTYLALGRLAASADSPAAVELCLRAVDAARAIPTRDRDERVKALARATCALLMADPVKAQPLLHELRGEIKQMPDPIDRTLTLGDLAMAARARDGALAADLFDEAVAAFGEVRANAFAEFSDVVASSLSAAARGQQPTGGVSPALAAMEREQELLTRGSHLLVEGFTISPGRAADACEIAFKLFRPAATRSAASLSEMLDMQGRVLQLLARHDPKRAASLADSCASRVARAGALTEVGVALATLDPSRARQHLDTAWQLSEEEIADLARKFGGDGHGQFMVEPPDLSATVGRLSGAYQAPTPWSVTDAGTAIREPMQLLEQARRLSDTIEVQAHLAVATRYAGGDRRLALERSERALEVVKMVPRWGLGAGSPLSFAPAAAVSAAYALDQEAGDRAAREIKRILDRKSEWPKGMVFAGLVSDRCQFAASLGVNLSLINPAKSLGFLVEAIELAPERSRYGDMASELDLFQECRTYEARWLSQVAAQPAFGGPSAESVRELAERVPKVAKRRAVWAPVITRSLTGLALLWASAPESG